MTTQLIQRIKAFNAPFLTDKVELKYFFMAENAYRFFRGTCHLFYEDLSQENLFLDGPKVWMCGDLHVENLGSYKGDNRLVYFDLNDFDEALLGYAKWELVRMVTSIFVVFDQLNIEEKKADKWSRLFMETYAKALIEGKARYIEPRIATGIVRKFLDSVSARSEVDLIKKHIEKRKGKLVFIIDDQKHFKVEKVLKKELLSHITSFIDSNEESPYNYKALDVCFRVAGTGSLGVKRFLYLLQSTKNKKDFLLLDMKQATPSSLSPYNNITQPDWPSEAIRTVSIQNMVQNIAPALLSTTIFNGDSYVIAEMQPVEDKIDFTQIKNKYREVCEVISAMAVLTASAHLRSGGRKGSATADELIEFGHQLLKDTYIISYAKSYSGKVLSDYNEFLGDYKKGLYKL